MRTCYLFYSNLCNYAEEWSRATILQHLFLWQCNWWYVKHIISSSSSFFFTKSFYFISWIVSVLLFEVLLLTFCSACLITYFGTHCLALVFLIQVAVLFDGKTSPCIALSMFLDWQFKKTLHCFNHTGYAWITFRINKYKDFFVQGRISLA